MNIEQLIKDLTDCIEQAESLVRKGAVEFDESNDHCLDFVKQYEGLSIIERHFMVDHCKTYGLDHLIYVLQCLN